MKFKEIISCKAATIILFSVLSFMSFAQEAEAAEEVVEEVQLTWGQNLFNHGSEVIGILLILVIALFAYPILRMAKKAAAGDVIDEKSSEFVPDTRVFGEKLMDWLGGKNTKEDVERLDLRHDYDGISELDNNIPAWWNIAFAGTVIFGVIYLIRVFITGGIPDQISELKETQRVAAIQVEAYLKKSANNVDENTVVMLDEAAIANGKARYEKSCAACHAVDGGGGIGPNLVDDHWLHGGKINDIFYSIKYGWPDKGMISWKDQFSPVEIAELASYIKSIQGTTPADPKDPEGEIFKEE
ncbi:MAG: c-type cytochrome [Brumimicrobium sp.]|nr:c-type cytochrome [Brumimicrobium sp.]